MNFIKDKRYPLYTFGIVFAVIFFVYATIGMFPFGDRQVMIIDSWHQYFPFFKDLSMRLRNGQSLMFSLDTGMGSNYIALIAYYAMSPLNLLSVLVPEKYLREFFYIAIILKTAFGGMFFSIYIKGVFKKNDLSLTVFGLMYAFSAFFINFYWNTMWLDSVALLPLILLGLHKLIDENKYKLYIITLAIAIMSNFYIGYFICEFIAIYYFALYFMKKEKFEIKDFLINLAKVALASLVALMMVAIVLLPIYFAMKDVYGLESYNPKKAKTYYSMFEILANMLVNMKPTIIDGKPNIYSSILALALSIIYFFTDVDSRKKIVNGLLIAFLLLSFNINYLNFAWHGFHFPNQVPYRFSFLFSFVVITMAYESYLHLSSVSVKKIIKVIAGLIVFALFLEQMDLKDVHFSAYYLSILAFLIYGFAIALYSDDKLKKDAFLAVVLMFIISEGILLGSNALAEGGSSGRGDYYPNLEDVNTCLEYIEDKDNSFYRMEIVPRFVTNDSVHYGYRGIAQFSSMANSHVSKFTRKIGTPSDAGSNTIGYLATTPAVNALLNVKYILSKNDNVYLPNVQYDVIKETDTVTALENKYYLSLGFMVNESVESVKFNKKKSFDNQENFYKAATGLDKNFYIDFEHIDADYDNINIKSVKNGRFNYNNIDKNSKGSGTVYYEISEPGQYYMYFLNQNQKVRIFKNGQSTKYKARRGVISDLGICEVGDNVRVEFDVDAQASGYFDIRLVKFDEEAFAEHIDILDNEVLNVEEFSDTYIKGTVDVKNSGILYTSIPYDKGFTAYVDGDEVSLRNIDEGFITLALSEGKHVVEFKYMTRGLKLGALISGLAILTLVFSSLFFKFRKKKELVEEVEELDDEIDFSELEEITKELDDEKPINLEEIFAEEDEE